MELSIKGKTQQIVSLRIDDLLPFIRKAIKEDLGLSEDEEIHYISDTELLSFNVIRNDAQRSRCPCKNCVSNRKK